MQRQIVSPSNINRRLITIYSNKKNKYGSPYDVGLGKLLGDGNFGKVYQGYISVKSINQKIAIKIIPINDNSQNIRILRQAQIMNKIDHKYCLKLIDYSYNQQQNQLYLILPLCKETLLNKIQSKTLNQNKIFNYCKNLSEAINYLHQQFKNQNIIIHRDLKQSNILFLQQQGQQIIKIADYGSARFINKDQIYNLTPYAIGTLKYQSPQMISLTDSQDKFIKNKYTQKCDLWSIGIIILEMLNYKLFSKKIIKKKQDLLKAQYTIEDQLIQFRNQLDSNDQINQQFSGIFVSIVTNLLQYQQKDRWNSQQFLQAMKKYQKQISKGNKNNKIIIIKKIKLNQHQMQQYLYKKLTISWYDIHKIQNIIAQSCIFLKTVIKNQVINSNCKPFHLYILLILSLCQYHLSYQNGIKNQLYQIQYKNQIIKSYKNVLKKNQENHLQQLYELVIKNLKQPSTSLIKQRFPELLQLNQILKDIQKIRKLLKQYVQLFQEDLRLCPTVSKYIVIFIFISKKQIYLKTPHFIHQLANEMKLYASKLIKMKCKDNKHDKVVNKVLQQQQLYQKLKD